MKPKQTRQWKGNSMAANTAPELQIRAEIAAAFREIAKGGISATDIFAYRSDFGRVADALSLSKPKRRKAK